MKRKHLVFVGEGRGVAVADAELLGALGTGEELPDGRRDGDADCDEVGDAVGDRDGDALRDGATASVVFAIEAALGEDTPSVEGAGRIVAAAPLAGASLRPPRPARPIAATATAATPPATRVRRRFLDADARAAARPGTERREPAPGAAGGCGSHTALIAGP
jgi:hypothetical protein